MRCPTEQEAADVLRRRAPGVRTKRAPASVPCARRESVKLPQVGTRARHVGVRDDWGEAGAEWPGKG